MRPPAGASAAPPKGGADHAVPAAGGTVDAAPAGAPPEGADRLARAAISGGEAVEVGGNQPIRLDTPDSAWFVERGALDVFLVERSGGESVSGLRHALRVGTGGLAFCASRSGAPLVLVARALRGSRLRLLTLQQLRDRDCGDEVAARADAWISDFAAAIADRIEPRPRPDHLLDPARPGERITVEADSVVAARPGGLVWARAENGEALAYLGAERPEDGGTVLVPLTSAAWLTVQSPSRIEAVSSLELQGEGRLAAALADFHGMALAAEHLNQRLLVVDEINEQTASAAQRRRDEAAAASSLLGILSPSGRHSTERAGSALLGALRLVGEHECIAFRPPPRQRRQRFPGDSEPDLAAVLNASGVRARKVSLLAEDRWWSGDSGAMLGFRRDDGRPVALLPGKMGRYRVSDAESGRSLRLNAARAAALRREAWCFYPALPDDRSARTRDVLRIARVGMGPDLARFATAGMLAGASTLAPSIAVGALAGWVLPSAARAMLPQTVVAMAAFASFGVLLHMVQGTAMMRIEGRVTARVSAALWDRVLRMPSAFFKEFTVGDLTTRLFALQQLRDQFSAVVSNALFSFLFLTPTLVLLFLYDTALACAAVAVGLASLLITAAIGLRQFKPQRRRYEATRNLSGELLQFVNGMGKLRSAGAEASASASWARGYRDQQLAVIRINRLNEHLIAFSAAAPALAGAVLFAAALWQGTEHLAVGDFLVVHAVSMTFYLAVTGLGRSFEVIAAALPAYGQLDRLLVVCPGFV